VGHANYAVPGAATQRVIDPGRSRSRPMNDPPPDPGPGATETCLKAHDDGTKEP
jgi:hypothetical protein